MSDSRLQLGISEFTTWPWTFEHDVEAYARHGIDAIEITEFKLDPERIAEQFALVAAHGLRVSSVQATIHGLFPTKLQPEPVAPVDRARHIRASIERLAPYVPPHTPFVVITGAAPGGDIAAAIDTTVDSCRELAEYAHARGVRIALEPLNPSLMNVDSAVCALDDALAIVERVAHPAFGLCLDAWNVWQSRALLETIARAGTRIFLVQLSDWRPPRALYDRLAPGTGCIPLDAIVRATAAGGYRGPYVVEIFSSESLPDSLWRSDLDALLDASAAGFERLSARAGRAMHEALR